MEFLWDKDIEMQSCPSVCSSCSIQETKGSGGEGGIEEGFHDPCVNNECMEFEVYSQALVLVLGPIQFLQTRELF